MKRRAAQPPSPAQSPVVEAEDKGRLRELREGRGLSQAALAEAVSVSRQSINAIETGRSVPAVDLAIRIARELGANVEAIFATETSDESLDAQAGLPGSARRVALARIEGAWLHYPLAGFSTCSADGVLGQRGRSHAVTLQRSAPECERNVILMGCALGLGLLADRLNAQGERGRVHWFSVSSGSALKALSHGRTHLAGVHLVDARTGQENVPDVRRHAGTETLALVTFARWEAGYVVAKGNPRGIRGGDDLGRRGVRLVARERGSGARRLLERELDSAGLSLKEDATLFATSHLEVAYAVSLGAADTGLATRDAALAFELDFVPVTEERYDLALPLARLGDPRLARLFDVMTGAMFRRELSALGYDVRSTGERVAEVSVA